MSDSLFGALTALGPFYSHLKFAILFWFTFVVLLGMWGIIFKILGMLEKNQAKWKDISTFITLCIIPMLAYFVLAMFNITPPILKNEIISPDNIKSEVEAVEKTGKELIHAFEFMDKLTISEVRDLVNKVKDYTVRANELNRLQGNQIATLRQTAEQETAKAKEAEALAATVKSLTSDQLNAVKFLITKDATEQARQSFINGVIASFFVGLMVAALWDKIRKLRRRVKDKVSDDISYISHSTLGPKFNLLQDIELKRKADTEEE
jgi:hypothetical protein